MFKTLILAPAAVLLSVGFNSAAKASLIGSTVGYDRIADGIDDSGLGTAVVGAGVEFNEFDVLLSDLDDSTIGMTFGTDGNFGFSGNDGIQQFIEYTGLTWVNDPTVPISSIDVAFGGWTQSSAPSPFSSSNVSISGPNAIKVAIGGYSFTRDTFLNISITPEHDLPEPATIALFGFGLAGLSLAARRRRLG